MTELDKAMYYGAKPVTLEAARILRKGMTRTEKLLWDELKEKQIRGLRFRRQHPISFYIADFYCHEVRLVVETDGKIHDLQKEYDDGREAEMEKYYIKTLRFTNHEVENNIEKVVTEIEKQVMERLKAPPGGLGGKN
jgi:very-short-patch-repair endonuclease